MRRVVEERQARVREVAEVEDVERVRRLIEALAVLARIEAEERAEEEADRGLVGDDENALLAIVLDDLQQSGERAGGDGQAALAIGRREAVGVVVVTRVLL